MHALYTSLSTLHLQLELVNSTLHQVHNRGIVQGVVLVGHELDNLLRGDATKEGRGRRGSKETTADAEGQLGNSGIRLKLLTPP